MTDEYQDTNDVQDYLFESISQNSANRFMVGDVKQSIYSFRQAMPDIFIRYKDKFPRYDREKDAYPASIVLDRNFRSRKTVTESVNFVFTQLMSRTCGGIDYVGDEKLAAGAQYPKNRVAKRAWSFWKTSTAWAQRCWSRSVSQKSSAS